MWAEEDTPEKCAPDANLTGGDVQPVPGYKQRDQVCAEFEDSSIYLCVPSQPLL